MAYSDTHSKLIDPKIKNIYYLESNIVREYYFIADNFGDIVKIRDEYFEL